MIEFIKIKDAQPMGEYRPTTIDALKASADFRIVYVGNKYTIKWREGKTEHITQSKLEKLQKSYTWATDF